MRTNPQGCGDSVKYRLRNHRHLILIVCFAIVLAIVVLIGIVIPLSKNHQSALQFPTTDSIDTKEERPWSQQSLESSFPPNPLRDPTPSPFFFSESVLDSPSQVSAPSEDFSMYGSQPLSSVQLADQSSNPMSLPIGYKAAPSTGSPTPNQISELHLQQSPTMSSRPTPSKTTNKPTGNPTEPPTRETTAAPSQQTSVVPTASISEGETNTPATYVPGHLTRSENGLLLSEGLKSRILAQSGQRVPYGTGGQSSINFHGLPDFGAIYKDERPGNEGGWIYVSNSEVRLIKKKGGVGALTFDKHGNVMDYKMVLEGTTANCAGGKTPWNAWVSCEEHPSGLNWQVDPTGVREARPITLGMDGGLFETFAYDVRDRNEPHFFVTEDHFEGALRRFTPDSANWSDPWNILYGPGETEFLTLTPDSSGTAGQYGWTKNHETGKANAALHFQNAEGMDVYENELYFISKRFKSLFMLDLDTGTYTNQTTRHGLFDGGPDQLQRIVGDESELLYFTEDGGRDAGIHARNVKGQYFTILESPVYIDETSGLDFSPDATRMYVAYQKSGLLFEIRREDGLPFHGKTLNVKYHATSN